MFPDHLEHGDKSYRVTYRSDPEALDDGVTIEIGIDDLALFPSHLISWGVAGILEERVELLIRSLSKWQRQACFPIAEALVDFLDLWEGWEPRCELTAALAEFLSERSGHSIEESHFNPERLPPQLRPKLRVDGDEGEELALGEDVQAIRDRLAGVLRERTEEAANLEWEMTGGEVWSFGEVPVQVAPSTPAGDRELDPIFPGLVDEGETVGMRAFLEEEEAQESHRAGCVRLFLLEQYEQVGFVRRKFPMGPTSRLYASVLSAGEDLTDDLMRCAVEGAMGGQVRSGEEFAAASADGKGRLFECAQAVCDGMEEAVESYRRVSDWMERNRQDRHLGEVVEDLDEEIEAAIAEEDLVVGSVLSGNRNFEGRIHQRIKANYLASPPLVVAYALAGTLDIDFSRDPLGHSASGEPVTLADIWPSDDEIRSTIDAVIGPEMFKQRYEDILREPRWDAIPSESGALYPWDDSSTYIRMPSFLEGIEPEPALIEPINGARVLVKVGDSVTTDHISPAGAFPHHGPAGQYLMGNGIQPRDFNSFGSRRGNHEVMVRGTFANIRMRNQIAPGTEGGFTTHFPSGETTSIYDASNRYRDDGIPLVVLAGSAYGTGSSRDWAAKGTLLLGVRAVIATSFERIHRSNLVGMGVLPLTFPDGEDADSLGLDGSESFDIPARADLEPMSSIPVTATRSDGSVVEFEAVVRLDTPVEVEYYRNGGILPTVLRNLAEA